MSSKKKLITAITSLAVVAVIAVVAVTVTLAALNATVNSSFTISYTALNVNAEITGQYTGDASQVSSGMKDFVISTSEKNNGDAELTDTDKKLEFKAETDTEVKKELSFKDLDKLTIVLQSDEDASNSYALLVYTIKNTDESKTLHVTWSLEGEPSNLTVTYATAASAEDANGVAGAYGQTKELDITAGQYGKVFVKIALTSKTTSGTLEGKLAFDLTSKEAV